MLNHSVNQIFHEKLMSIQNKIPVKLHIPSSNSLTFGQMLNDKITENKKIISQIDFNDIINEASNKFNIPQSIIKSVISAESSFNPNATSSSGAKGLMQLMPSTASHLGVKNIWDPKQNIEGGTKYLRELLDRYNGDITLALAAYNAGPSNVEKYNGVPPFKETQNYVNKVLSNISDLANI